jgi:hypothetical protein
MGSVGGFDTAVTDCGQYVHHSLNAKAKTFLTAHENGVNCIRCELTAFSVSSFSKDLDIAYIQPGFQMAPHIKMRSQVIVVAIPELLPHILLTH